MAELSEQLRTKTADLYQELEGLPFFQALHAGSLPKLAIVSFLRSLAIIHAVLEREFTRTSSRELAELSRHTVSKVPLLVADLEMLGAQDLPSVTAAIQIALEFAAEILVDADDPLSLVGTLYVLEGSQNGGIALKRGYAHSVESQLSYFGGDGRDPAEHWETFRELLDSMALEDGSSKTVVHSAIRCLERLKTICAALYPYSNTDLGHHVATINFEAGNHAMPQDPVEIALALRAGKITWEEHPYLEHRFGSRGKRFLDSDSCWLVALARMPIEPATKNLQWLRTMLASRGIPTAILEAHLRVISRALAADFPERVEMQTRFDPFLASLVAERGTFDAEAISRLVEEFDSRLSACSGLKVESAAELIASAWADERSGIIGELATVRDWFADSERFSDDWIEIVNRLGIMLDRVGTSPC